MEVAPGIHRIEAPLGERFVCAFLLVGTENILLVDTGMDDTPKNQIMPYLAAQGIEPQRVRYVLITHADFDHHGGNASLKTLIPNAVFMCHELDRPQIADIELLISQRYGEYAADHGMKDSDDTNNWIRANARSVPIDLGLRGGETLRLSPDWTVEILHTPGHSWGHLTVYDSRSKTAVIADSALWNSILTKDGRPVFPPTYRYVETYLGTIERLQGMPIDTLLTSHYPVKRGAEAQEFLGESRSYVDRVDAALIEALRAASDGCTLKELIATLKSTIGNWPEGAEGLLNFPLTGHLERLTHYGKVTLGRRDGLVTFAWKG